MQQRAGWMPWPICSVAQVGDLARRIENSPALNPAVTADNDPIWCLIRADEEAHRLVVFVRRDAGQLTGYAPFIAADTSIQLTIASRRVATRRVQRLTLPGGPSIAGSGDTDRPAGDSHTLVEMIREVFGGGERRPLLIHRMTDSQGFEAVARPAGLRLLAHGPTLPHYRIPLPQKFEEYLRQVGSKTRQMARQRLRYVERDYPGQARLQKFTAVEEVEPFLRDAVPISRKTWQWARPNSGALKDRAAVEQRFGAAARYGVWQSYILYLAEMPVSFVVGYTVRSVFKYFAIGYLPEYARLSVGTVTLLMLIKRLIEDEPTIRTLDFLAGEQDYKRHFGTTRTLDGDYYVFPPTVREGAFWAVARACAWLDGRAHAAAALVRRSKESKEERGKATREEAEPHRSTTDRGGVRPGREPAPRAGSAGQGNRAGA
jgi:hypothetical protein